MLLKNDILLGELIVTGSGRREEGEVTLFPLRWSRMDEGGTIVTVGSLRGEAGLVKPFVATGLLTEVLNGLVGD